MAAYIKHCSTGNVSNCIEKYIRSNSSHLFSISSWLSNRSWRSSLSITTRCTRCSPHSRVARGTLSSRVALRASISLSSLISLDIRWGIETAMKLGEVFSYLGSSTSKIVVKVASLSRMVIH